MGPGIPPRFQSISTSMNTGMHMSQRHRIRHLVPERTKFEGRLHSLDDARDYDALHSND